MLSPLMMNRDDDSVTEENDIIDVAKDRNLQFDQFCKTESFGVAIYTVSDLILIKANQHYLDSLELPNTLKNKCIGSEISKINPRWKQNLVQRKWDEAVSSQTVITITEYENVSANGEVTYWDSILIPILESGNINYMLCNTFNVTERVAYRKQIEEENKRLKAQSDHLKIVSENMNDALFIINKDGTYEYFNEYAKKMTQQAEDIHKVGDSLVHSKYYDENDRELSREEMPSSRVLQGETIENVVIRSERANFSAFFNFNGCPIYDENGILRSAILCFRDVTETYQITYEMKKQKEMLEIVFETMLDTIMISDRDGNILTISSKAHKHGHQVYKLGNLDNYNNIQYLDECYRPIPLEEMPHRRILRGEKVNHFKFIVSQSDEEDVFVDANASPIYADNGDIDFVVICCRDITDLKNKEREIIKQKKQLEVVMENMPDAFALFNEEGNVMYFNAEARKMYPHMGANKSVSDAHSNFIYYDLDHNQIDKANLPTFRAFNGEHIRNEKIIIQRSNKVQFTEINATPIFNNENNLESVAITHRDITEQMMYESTIKFQADMINLAGEAIFAWDLNGSIIFWNDGAEREYGYSKKEAIGHESHKLLKTVFPIQFELLKKELMEHGYWKGELIHTRKDGTIAFIDSSNKIIPDEQGRQIVIQTNRDITNYKKLSEQLQNEKHHIEAILDNMTEGLIVIDALGNLITLNAAAMQMCGISSAKNYKHLKDFKNIFELRSLDGKVISMEWALDKDAFSNHEIWICRKDSDFKWIGSFSGTPIYNKDGHLVMQIVTFSDVTCRKYKQEYLVKMEREKKEALEASIKLKDEFLYLITHEFKTPLAVMSSALQTMDLIYKDNIPLKAKKYLNTIKQNINRQIRLVNNLLDITRINSGSIKLNYGNHDIVYLTKSIVNSIQPIAQQKGVVVNFSSTFESKEIGIDEEKMERILLNLLSNALKFTPSNKTININLTAKKYKNKNMVYISVQDEGIGIPKDKQTYIFERFGQVNTSLSRQAEGTGIGLHLVKLFVHVLGGYITLESQEGKGSTFTVKLPTSKVKRIEDQTNLKENKLLVQGECRLIQTAEIELSDIYI